MSDSLDMRAMALEAAAYLREEADFNRSWTDGRRGASWTSSEAYIARRIEVAEQRDAWASAIEILASSASPLACMADEAANNTGGPSPASLWTLGTALAEIERLRHKIDLIHRLCMDPAVPRQSIGEALGVALL